ncbi:helix-turn-helix transcriptional regulator [Cellulomonas sp. ES6]|uniref:helix-turn-helix domain-containing protein n=1 Tax=Cellulomonas sp. ES6 TaxID=3039384 RepID=UPI0024B7C753|nr:helix-turn-helix transcriptional regulator [Cellulomonas sp. ES6]WHP18929.1 helix-turn-helix transcriptional regulator [Cellulomonas sp. ES6]
MTEKREDSQTPAPRDSATSSVDPVDDEQALAERIRTDRLYVGLSQADVAEVLGISRAAVSAIENGRRRVTGIELKRLAELFGTTGDRLLGRAAHDDPATTALFRATKSLSESDKQQVLRFAEFLRGAGQAPQAGSDTVD